MDNLSMRDFVRCSPLRLAAGLGLLFGLALAPTASPAELEEVSVPITAQEVGKAAEVRSLGATHRYYRLRVKPGDKVSVPFIATEVALLQTESVRLFFLDQSEGAWRVVSESRFDPKKGVMVASGVPGPGVYTVFGASRLADAYELQRGLCQGRDTARVVPQICTRIYCPADGLAELAEDILAEAPPGVGPGDLGVALGDTCQQCLLGPGEPREFPECQISELARPPALPIDLSGLIPWPRACFDAGNACIPGPYKVGQVDYNFEDELDLIPPGMTQPAYPDVDVRATVRYPAANTGVQQPVAGTGLYPLVLFLHGNHVTCPCSCSHACAPASRIPNHLGYNYLLDILASWGFVAVSIDGFDVTCAGSFAMSDYEARGRLILHHLGKWKDWNGSTTDPWGGLFHRRLNGRIGLSGHSRGGEGVVAAEHFDRVENLGFDIRAVNAIAPTDQDPTIRYVPQVPYYLTMAVSDGDVSNLQGLRTYDRTSLFGAAVQSEKSMLWVYGANHNFFNTSWTPGFGVSCASDDGIGEGRLSDSLQRLVACQTIVPFFRLHLEGGSGGFRKLFRGEVVPEGFDGIEAYWTFQDPVRREIDNFDSGDNPNTNSLGGTVVTSGGFSTFDEFEFKSSGPDLFNSSFRHFTHGLALGWGSTQTYQTQLPAGQRNVASFAALALRAAQILDGGVLNPLDTPRTLRVTLRTASGTEANTDFGVAGLQSIPFPYEYNGGKTVLGMIRIPLKTFRHGNAALPLTDIERVKIEFRGMGLVAIDDIQFTR